MSNTDTILKGVKGLTDDEVIGTKRPNMNIQKTIDSPSAFLGKHGEGVISFGAGNPDLSPPEEAMRVLPEKGDFLYGEIAGDLSLREKLAKRRVGANANEFVITNGSSEAIDLIFRVLRKDVDSILMPRPFYYSYVSLAEISGYKIDYYELKEGKVVLEDFKKKLMPNMIVMTNSPSNPLGSIQSKSVLLEIEAMCREKNSWLLTDEVYVQLDEISEDIDYTYEKVIRTDSLSKVFSLCGIRVGYFYSKNKQLIKDVTEIKTHSSMNTSLLSQRIAKVCLSLGPEYIKKNVLIWKERRDYLYSELKALGLEVIKPEGAFYIFVKFEGAKEAVAELFYEYKIIVYDGAWFGTPDHLRFSYSMNIDRMKEGISRLSQYLKKNEK